MLCAMALKQPYGAVGIKGKLCFSTQSRYPVSKRFVRFDARLLLRAEDSLMSVRPAGHHLCRCKSDELQEWPGCSDQDFAHSSKDFQQSFMYMTGRLIYFYSLRYLQMRFLHQTCATETSCASEIDSKMLAKFIACSFQLTNVQL
jgi:hypothetical protein